MDALLVSGGDAPERSRLGPRFGSFGLFCAADSGLDTMRAWGLVPDIIVGDMDSISDPALLGLYPNAQVLRADRRKDETDTELGLSVLAARGVSRIVLAGGGGGRLDHVLAIRALFERKLRPVEWHTAVESLYLVEAGAGMDLESQVGETISVFPLSSGAKGMWSEGLEWPLEGLEWGPGDFGLSNLASGGRVQIRAGEGDLLVLRLLSSGRPP